MTFFESVQHHPAMQHGAPSITVTQADTQYAVSAARDNVAAVAEVAQTVLAISKLGMALGGALLIGVAGINGQGRQ